MGQGLTLRRVVHDHHGQNGGTNGVPQDELWEFVPQVRLAKSFVLSIVVTTRLPPERDGRCQNTECGVQHDLNDAGHLGRFI